jgi:hypothetical protein
MPVCSHFSSQKFLNNFEEIGIGIRNKYCSVYENLILVLVQNYRALYEDQLIFFWKSDVPYKTSVYNTSHKVLEM